MGNHTSVSRSNADRAIGGMAQVKVDALMNKAIITKMSRIPQLDREREWTFEEVDSLASAEQAWADLTDDRRGVRFSYPSNWQLAPPVRIRLTRYERVVRTGHLLSPKHMRCSAEMSVGFANFNAKKPTEAISVSTFIKLTGQISEATRRIQGGALLVSETLRAGVFKNSVHPVVHNLSTFDQPDGTTTRVEQWMMLSKDRTMQCMITLFNSDLSAHAMYGDMQTRWRDSIELAPGHFDKGKR
jgi:hypothetical protein